MFMLLKVHHLAAADTMSQAKVPFRMDNTTEKHTVTLSEDTVEWLKSEYPDALSVQEAIRTAISDARMHKIVVSDNVEPPE